MSSTLLALAGMFSLGLGVWHLGVPRWFDFAGAIRRDDDAALRPMRLGRFQRPNSPDEALGLSWVMSNAASYVLVSIGAFDLLASQWVGTPPGRLVAAWIAGWWAVRAVSQLAVGRRRTDLVVIGGFATLALLNLFAAAALA